MSNSNERTRKQQNQIARSARTRSTVRGTQERPRLAVKISNTNISAQIINDDTATTIASFSTIGSKAKGTMTEKAVIVGEGIAKAASSKKVKKVVFDRGSKQYHGRMKALAETARKNGLEF